MTHRDSINQSNGMILLVFFRFLKEISLLRIQLTQIIVLVLELKLHYVDIQRRFQKW